MSDNAPLCNRNVHRCLLRSGALSWWHHQMETFSPLLALCAGNSLVSGEFPTQRPVTRSFDVFFDLCPNQRLSKHSWGWWFETPSCPLWRHRNGGILDWCIVRFMRWICSTISWVTLTILLQQLCYLTHGIHAIYTMPFNINELEAWIFKSLAPGRF